MKTNNKKINIRLGWLSILGNLVLFALKYWAGIVSGSIALIADAWHTLSDSATSIVLIIGSKAASKPADDEHPFGHGRAEHFSALIIGFLLAIVAFQFLHDSGRHLVHHERANYGTLAIVVTITSIIVKEALAQASFWGYRKNKSTALKADAWHHRTDALSSVIVLGGILLGNYFWWIDGVLGIIVAIMIGYTSYEILKTEFNTLMGESISDEMIQQMKDISLRETGKDNLLHHFHIHKYGHHTELSFHVKIDPELTLFDAHEYCTRIEKAIERELNVHVTIHAEPLERPENTDR
ncbi:cation transporter [Puteibacter caeruleilacunae]|nr:cation transporter [Puteibacter caeruleilacunae]